MFVSADETLWQLCASCVKGLKLKNSDCVGECSFQVLAFFLFLRNRDLMDLGVEEPSLVWEAGQLDQASEMELRIPSDALCGQSSDLRWQRCFIIPGVPGWMKLELTKFVTFIFSSLAGWAESKKPSTLWPGPLEGDKLLSIEELTGVILTRGRASRISCFRSCDLAVLVWWVRTDTCPFYPTAQSQCTSFSVAWSSWECCAASGRTGSLVSVILTICQTK